MPLVFLFHVLPFAILPTIGSGTVLWQYEAAAPLCGGLLQGVLQAPHGRHLRQDAELA